MLVLTCPACLRPDTTIATPDKDLTGWNGDWHCYACQRSGSYHIQMLEDPPARRALRAA
jgi:hypothetical protein